MGRLMFDWFDLRILWLLLALDLATTFYGLRQSGIGEANPFSRVLIDHAGRVLYVAARVLLTALLTANAQFLITAYGFAPFWALSAYCAVVIISNVRLIWRARS
jgi:hypothetical protein